jgi:hypothetical protein
VISSRRSEESVFPWVLLLGAVSLAACSSSKGNDGHPDAGVADAGDTILPSGDVRPAEDASAAEVDPPCALRGENNCTTSAGCFAIRGIPFVDLCQGREAPTFAGCVAGGPDGGTMIRWGRQESTGEIFQFPTTQMPGGWTTIAEPACTPDGGADTIPDDVRAGDAGACTGEVGDLYRLGWIQPCPSLVDAGVPVLFCQSPGIGVFGAQCGQRQTLRWDWGSHSMTCFYEQGVLVGLRMANDTPSFCTNTSNGIEVGSIEECPPSTETMLINCDPLKDGGYSPYPPG